MGIFITLKNVDRFPGLTIRVKGKGDEIELNYEAPVKPVFVSGSDGVGSSQDESMPTTEPTS